MTTNVSQLHDAFKALVNAELPTYERIPNPYDPQANASLILNKGYGIGYGPATNSERELSGRVSLRREFFIVLVQQVVAFDTDGDGRATIEKDLLEDQLLLIKAIEADPALNGDLTATKFLSDGGIEFLQSNEAKFFLVELQFESEYFENL